MYKDLTPKSIINFKHFLLLIKADDYFYEASKKVQELGGDSGLVFYDDLFTLMELINMNMPKQVLSKAKAGKV